MYMFAGVTRTVRHSKTKAASEVGDDHIVGKILALNTGCTVPRRSHTPAVNSTTPVHATWNSFDPGRYQKPHAPVAGMMLAKSFITVK
jgi:hypothetical protein